MASMTVSKTVRLGSNPSAPAIWFLWDKNPLINFIKNANKLIR